MAGKNGRLVCNTAAATAYTAPAGGAKITTLHVANVTASTAYVYAQWRDVSAGNALTRLAFGSEVKGNDAINIPGGGLILEDGDFIEAYGSTNGALELTVGAVVAG